MNEYLTASLDAQDVLKPDISADKIIGGARPTKFLRLLKKGRSPVLRLQRLLGYIDVRGMNVFVASSSAGFTEMSGTGSLVADNAINGAIVP